MYCARTKTLSLVFERGAVLHRELGPFFVRENLVFQCIVKTNGTWSQNLSACANVRVAIRTMYVHGHLCTRSGMRRNS